MTRARHGLASTEEELGLRDRKAEHIRLALQDRMQLKSHFFEEYHFEHCALPEIDFADIDISVEFLGKRLAAPLLISCMTGGTESAARINRNLAQAAEETQIALGVGSQRKALENPLTADTFRVREVAPTIPLLANLGAVQLNYGCGVTECQEVVDMIQADALVFHLNPLQEALQPEGQVNFKSLLPKMGEVVQHLEVPVIAKEIGCGISAAVARSLTEVGIRIIDTAGLGGTSWSRIEGQRASDEEMGELFANWGIPTPEAIQALSQVPDTTIIASGGLRNGVDAAKAVALGAHMTGMAYPFLNAATQSPEAVVERIKRSLHELRVSMFCLGVRTLAELRNVRLIRR